MVTLVVAANLGHLKTYRAVHTPNRGLKLELADEQTFPDAHNRYSDMVTDMAGRFPVTRSAGPSVQAATGEGLTAEIELQRRLIKAVAQSIEANLRREAPARWALAAPAEICQALLNDIAPDLRDSLWRTVSADLTKVPPDEIPPHFE